jgi:hypothetical protein
MRGFNFEAMVEDTCEVSQVGYQPIPESRANQLDDTRYCCRPLIYEAKLKNPSLTVKG